MSAEVVEDFRSTSGRITGVVGLLVCAAVVIYGVFTEGFPATVIWVTLLVAVLVWTSTLRPKISATSSALVLRNAFSTTSLPLTAIEQVVVSQVLAVRVGEKRHVSPAVGKSWRQAAKSNRATRAAGAGPETAAAASEASYPVFVEERISKLAEDARAAAGVKLMSDEQLELASGVRRDWAWPELAALAVAAAGLVASLII